MSNRAGSSRSRSPRLNWLRRSFTLLAWLYPIALIATVSALALVGERFWLTAAALYLPRLSFAAPLPVLTLGLWWLGQRRLLWTQVVAAIIVIWPLMGLVLPGSSFTPTSAQRLRLLSFNVDTAHAGDQAIVSAITEVNADVVLLVEALGNYKLADALRAHYPNVQSSTQFLIASRFPIISVSELDRIPYYGRERSPRAIRYLIEAPWGRTAFYAVHPISPRGAFHFYRFRGALHQLRHGELFTPDQESEMRDNAGLRALQIRSVARLAEAESVPVVIAGDTNLPHLSPVLRDLQAGREDAFRAASSGFGYTYPSRHPFLRLDRIVVGPELGVVQFHIGCPGASDHLCVWADLAR